MNQYNGWTVGEIVAIDFFDTPPDNRRNAKIVALDENNISVANLNNLGDVKTFSWSQFYGRNPVAVITAGDTQPPVYALPVEPLPVSPIAPISPSLPAFDLGALLPIALIGFVAFSMLGKKRLF